jgi:hypothetical protein
MVRTENSTIGQLQTIQSPEDQQTLLPTLTQTPATTANYSGRSWKTTVVAFATCGFIAAVPLVLYYANQPSLHQSTDSYDDYQLDNIYDKQVTQQMIGTLSTLALICTAALAALCCCSQLCQSNDSDGTQGNSVV